MKSKKFVFMRVPESFHKKILYEAKIVNNKRSVTEYMRELASDPCDLKELIKNKKEKPLPKNKFKMGF